MGYYAAPCTFANPTNRDATMSILNRFRSIVGNKPGEAATAEAPAAEKVTEPGQGTP